MKKIIVVLLVLISSSAVAQYDHYPPDENNKQDYNENSASFYLNRAGSKIQFTVALQLISGGLAVGSAFVDQETGMIMLAGAGMGSLAGIITFVTAGSDLKSAAEALERKKQKGLSFEGTTNGVGLVFRF